MLDLLLTSDTISDATAKSYKRMEGIWIARKAVQAGIWITNPFPPPLFPLIMDISRL